MRVAYFGPMAGEFGWELMAWQAWCRAESHKYDRSYVCSFPNMAALYEDFATFIPHEHKKRETDFDDISKIKYELPPDVTDHIKPVKTYQFGGDFIKFGRCGLTEYPILIHARGIPQFPTKNYPEKKWNKIVSKLDSPAASIGTTGDRHITGTADMRGLPLDELMDLIASAKLVIGGSSGVMHLVSLCGTPHVVWGDAKTYFWETLETRYKKTWNPLGTPCEYIYHNKWQPSPLTIVKRAHKLLSDIRQDVEITSMQDAIAAANRSGHWLTTISYIDGDRIICTWNSSNYPGDKLLPSLQQLGTDMVRNNPEILPGAAALYGAESWH